MSTLRTVRDLSTRDSTIFEMNSYEYYEESWVQL